MPREIQEWEIWHTYVTYLESTEIYLQATARRLVTFGIAECATLSDGHVFWRSNGADGCASTVIIEDPLGGPPGFQLQPDDGCKEKLGGFALEAWGQASYFLTSERRVLGDVSPLPPPYLRAHLGLCVLTPLNGESRRVYLYPSLLVYESGVVIVEFRMIGPEDATTLENFIDGGVNLFTHKFERVEVNPGLAKFATRAYYQSSRKWSFFRRLQLLWLQAGHDFAVKQRTTKYVDSDFSFDLAQLSGEEAEDLSSIALTIFHTVSFIAGSPRIGLSFLLWGQPLAPVVGEFWSGRPHIHLIRFDEQCKTAAENEARHGPDLGRILSRSAVLDETAARALLPNNGRLFQDYGAYVGPVSSLWVWSQEGLLREGPRTDPNRGNLVYERQVLVELLEYGYMLYRSLYHRVENFDTTKKVLSVRKEILRLQHSMREVSPSGEIRELLESGWREFGLPDLIAEIDAGLALRESETRSVEALRSTRIGWALTVLFGLITVPTLADQVVKPVWKLTSFHQFSNASLATVVADGVAFLIVLLLLAIVVSVVS